MPSFAHAPATTPATSSEHAVLIAGQFQILGPMGNSLTGRTYLGRHVELGRPVVVKLMHVGRSATTRARFEREARALSLISHEHVARLLAYGATADGGRYMVLEHIDGRTLRAALSRWGRLTERRALRIMDQLAQALEAVHGAGLVHRNLKPESVLLGETRAGLDTVKLTNFGLVRDTLGASPAGGEGTRTQAMTGTPRYWAPEQALGESTDARTDLYAFGALAFELLTGQTPFESSTTEGFAWQHVHQRPNLRDERGHRRVPKAIGEVLERCLAKRPADRFQSATEVRRALRKAAARPAAARVKRNSGRIGPAEPLGKRVRAYVQRPDVWLTVGVGLVAGLLGAALG